MAFISEVFAPRPVMSRKLSALATDWRRAQRKRALRDRTFRELAALSDRDLCDLNISRADIRAIARDAAERD